MSEFDEEELSTAIAELERQRASLGDAVVEPAIAALRRQMNARSSQLCLSMSLPNDSIIAVDTEGE